MHGYGIEQNVQKLGGRKRNQFLAPLGQPRQNWDRSRCRIHLAQQLPAD